MLTFLVVISFGILVYTSFGLSVVVKRLKEDPSPSDEDVVITGLWFASLVLVLALLFARIFG